MIIDLEALALKRLYENATDEEKYQLIRKIAQRANVLSTLHAFPGLRDYSIMLATAEEQLFEVSHIPRCASTKIIFVPRLQQYIYQPATSDMMHVIKLGLDYSGLDLEYKKIMGESKLLDIIGDKLDSKFGTTIESIELDLRSFIYLTPEQREIENMIRNLEQDQSCFLSGTIKSNKDFLLLFCSPSKYLEILNKDPQQLTITNITSNAKLTIQFKNK